MYHRDADIHIFIEYLYSFAAPVQLSVAVLTEAVDCLIGIKFKCLRNALADTRLLRQQNGTVRPVEVYATICKAYSYNKRIGGHSHISIGF